MRPYWTSDGYLIICWRNKNNLHSLHLHDLLGFGFLESLVCSGKKFIVGLYYMEGPRYVT